MRRKVLLGLVAVTTATSQAQSQRWLRNYDVNLNSNGTSAIIPLSSGGFVFTNIVDVGEPGTGFQFCLLDSAGNVILSRIDTLRPDAAYYNGYSGSMVQLTDGTFLQGASAVANSDPDGVLICYAPSGDTLWVKAYPITGLLDNVSALDVVDSMGFALFSTVLTGQYYDMRLIRTDSVGNELWSQTYGGWEDQQCTSGHRTLDGGFVMAGFNYFNNDNSDLYVVKVDSLGNQQWAQSYGSPWLDNVGFITQLPDSGFILAGAVRISETGVSHASFHRLDAQGGVLWTNTYLDVPERTVFFADPVVLWDGYVAAGSRSLAGNTYGSLFKCDLAGELVWRRVYQTNAQTDHYFYDVERTLDGGFIMAGTAFDSLLISQDAWLVKVDSFGCLVPGCQIFDGLEEQFTDLGAALTLFPNPVLAGQPFNVQLDLPTGFKLNGPLRLAMVSTDGRVVAERSFPGATSAIELSTSHFSSGLYFLHVLDGSRWLCGGKVVLE